MSVAANSAHDLIPVVVLLAVVVASISLGYYLASWPAL